MELQKNNQIDEKKKAEDEDLKWYDDGVGLKVTRQKCLHCKFNGGEMCNKFNEKKMDLGIDLTQCPYFEEKDEDVAAKLFGVK